MNRLPFRRFTHYATITYLPDGILRLERHHPREWGVREGKLPQIRSTSRLQEDKITNKHHIILVPLEKISNS